MILPMQLSSAAITTCCILHTCLCNCERILEIATSSDGACPSIHSGGCIVTTVVIVRSPTDTYTHSHLLCWLICMIGISLILPDSDAGARFGSSHVFRGSFLFMVISLSTKITTIHKEIFLNYYTPTFTSSS